MNPDILARQKSLEDLQGAMDEDEIRRVPGFTIKITPDGEAHPTEGPGQDLGVGGAPEDDPFEQLLARKRMGQ